MENKSKELEVAIQAALEAGKILERHFETDILKEFKEDKSVVTIADKEAEEVIKKIILAEFPNHSIIGEETGMTKNTGDHTWCVDPVDGTRNFANGIPFFAVSVALLNEKEPVVGVVYNPATNSLFYAEKGKGSYLNDKKIQVSQDPAEKALMTVSSGRKSIDRKIRRGLMHDLPERIVSSVRDLGSTALDLSYLARGSTEADIKFGLDIYDLAAGVLLVTEAGGLVTNTEGGEWNIKDTSFIASNGLFHDVLIEEVKKQKEKLNL